MNCFRYLGYTSCDQVDALTLKEYAWLMEACELRLVDEEFNAHRQAFLNVKASATDKRGKLVYKQFNKFFDYDKAISQVKTKRPPSGRFSRLKEHLRKEDNNG